MALPLAALALTVRALWGLLLRSLVLVLWTPRGHNVLVVYSNSPYWQGYFEDRIVPRLGARCVVLNWSERGEWSPTLAASLFRFYGGPKAYNPLVVVLHPFRRAKVFRFWPAFRDVKNGRSVPLQQLEEKLFELVDPP